MGMMYLKFNPENNSIRQFCEFIQGNRQERRYFVKLVIKMVSDENDYTDGSSDEE